MNKNPKMPTIDSGGYIPFFSGPFEIANRFFDDVVESLFNVAIAYRNLSSCSTSLSVSSFDHAGQGHYQSFEVLLRTKPTKTTTPTNHYRN